MKPNRVIVGGEGVPGGSARAASLAISGQRWISFGSNRWVGHAGNRAGIDRRAPFMPSAVAWETEPGWADPRFSPSSPELNDRPSGSVLV